MSPRAQQLQSTLDAFMGRHRLDGFVVADAEGLLIGSSSATLDPEGLAATSPFLNSGVQLAPGTPVPTASRSVSVGDSEVYVSAVGEPGRCASALEEASKWVKGLLAS